MEELKICRGCKVPLPKTTEYFRLASGNIAGRRFVNRCRPCQNAYLKESRKRSRQRRLLEEAEGVYITQPAEGIKDTPMLPTNEPQPAPQSEPLPVPAPPAYRRAYRNLDPRPTTKIPVELPEILLNSQIRTPNGISIAPRTYYLTSGDAYHKTLQLIEDLEEAVAQYSTLDAALYDADEVLKTYDCLVAAKALVNQFAEIRGTAIHLECEWLQGRLLVRPTDPKSITVKNKVARDAMLGRGEEEVVEEFS